MSAIIMYENGKAVGGEGHTSDSSDITFDNTGTDLVSEEVESAIKEVNARTKHGIVELWANSDITQNFAGQTVTINNYDTTKYDAVWLIWQGVTNERFGAKIAEIDNDGLSINTAKTLTEMDTNLNYVFVRHRNFTTAISGTTVTFTFSDATAGNVQVSNGTVTAESTNNECCVPVRILGLIHNS